MTVTADCFLADDSGATSVDWVVLSGGAVALAVIMLSTMNGATSSVADEMETVLNGVAVQDIATLGRDEE